MTLARLLGLLLLLSARARVCPVTPPPTPEGKAFEGQGTQSQ